MGAGENCLAASPSPARLPSLTRKNRARMGRTVGIWYWNCVLFPLKNRETSSIRVWLMVGLGLAAGVGFSWLVWQSDGSDETKPAADELPRIFVVDAEQQFPDVAPKFGRLPGEFEHHEAIVIGWPVESPQYAPKYFAKFRAHANKTLTDLISQIPESLEIIVVVPTESRRDVAREILAEAGIPADRVRIMITEVDTPWVRDFAPFSMAHDQITWLTGRFYRDPGDRIGDVKMSAHFSGQWNMEPAETPFFIDGGNVLSNGKGLIITTTHTLELNRKLGYGRDDVSRMLREYFGARQIVYLESLKQDVNQHIDMFVTIPDSDTVVLAEYTKEQDPANHFTLERNYQRLLEVERDEGPLNIVRIPMPPRGTDFFGGTYTNVVYANGVLFVPEFSGVDEAGQAKAIETYQQLLPDWKIIPIESSAWIVLEGSLHCLTKNIYQLPAKDRCEPAEDVSVGEL